MKFFFKTFPPLLTLIIVFSFAFVCVRKAEAAIVNSSQNTKLTNGLIGLWSFDGNDILNDGDSHIVDRSGNGNDGTLTNIPSVFNFFTAGKIGQAGKFVRANSNFISLPDLRPNILSISAWIRTTDSSDEMEVVSKVITGGDPFNPAYAISLNAFNGSSFSGKVAFNTYRDGNLDGWAEALSVTTVTDGKWHHIVGTDDGSNIKIYVYNAY